MVRLILAILLFSATASAQVAPFVFASSGAAPPSVVDTGFGIATGLSASCTISISGTNTYVLAAAVFDGKYADSIMIGTQKMGEIGTSIETSDGIVLQWYGLKNPTAGEQTVTVATYGSTAIELGVISFSGVNQTTPTSGEATAVATGTSISQAVASATNNMVVDAVASWLEGPSSSSQTTQMNTETSGYRFAMSTKAGATSTTMAWSLSGSVNNAWRGISVNAAP